MPFELGRRRFLQVGLGASGWGLGLARNCDAAEPDSASTTPINIITSDSNLTSTIIAVAQRKRFLENLGLAPKIVKVADSSKIIPALLSGEMDVSVLSGFSLIFPAIERGAGLALLGGSCNLPLIAVYSSKPDITSVADLKGRSIGIGAYGALTHQFMVALLRKKGIDPSAVVFRNIGSNADIFRAVAEGTVDAGPSGLDVYYQQDKYHTHALVDGDLWKELPEYTYQGSFTSRHAIAAKRAAIVRTLAGFAKVYRFIQQPDSREDFIGAYMEAVGKKNTAEAETSWTFIQKFQPYSIDIILSDDRIRYMQNLNLSLGVQKKLLTVEQTEDTSIAREALKLLS